MALDPFTSGHLLHRLYVSALDASTCNPDVAPCPRVKWLGRWSRWKGRRYGKAFFGDRPGNINFVAANLDYYQPPSKIISEKA